MSTFSKILNRKTQFVTKYSYGPGVVDLGEYVLSFASGCRLGCEYCYLKFVKVPSGTSVYSNIDLLYKELEFLFQNEEGNLYFNCGETTDSFLTEEHINTICKIITFLSTLNMKFNKQVLVELRTKTVNITKLNLSNVHIDDKIKIVYSLSLLPENVREVYECSTSDVFSRIDTISYVLSHTPFLVGLRFEPIILLDYMVGYNEIMNSVEKLLNEYEKIIKKCYSKLSGNIDRLHSVSISCLRLTKSQYKHFKSVKSKLCYPEMVMCIDGKYRYSKPVREKIYNGIIEILKNVFSSQVMEKVYLSTEFSYIWECCKLAPRKLTEF